MQSDEKKKVIPKSAGLFYPVLMGFIFLFVIYITMGKTHNEQDFDIGNYSQYQVGRVETAFLSTSSNEDLLLLIKVLCYEYKNRGNQGLAQPLKQYGKILLSRAKSGEVDLQTIDNEEVMLKILGVIRSL